MSALQLKLSVFLSLVCCFKLCVLSENIIKIKNGKIVGADEEYFVAFRGIPYAEPPVGELRFVSPKQYSQTWEGVIEFKNYSEVCAQYDHLHYSFDGSEDCLTLNVFVPKSVLQSTEKVPVISFLHGGAFMFGGSDIYLPDNIMKYQNMILVTINYRLGVLGFLSTEDEVIPGNFGLKDQVEALRWIQRNIESFNGDPQKVTIVGFSAGGASVHLHYMSPLTKGLFNNGISHSGVAINPWVMMENARQKSYDIASLMNCSQQDHREMLNCLRQKPAEDLVMLAKNYQPFLYNPFSPFGVVVEPPSESAFLTDHPMKLLKSGNFQKLPWLLSQAQDEGLYPAAEFYNDEYLKTINDEWDELAPFILDFNGTTTDNDKKLEISREIKEFYLKDRPITKKSFDNLKQMITDRLYHSGAKKSLELQSKFSATYFYYFRFITKTGIATELNNVSADQNRIPYLGVSHGDDVFLIYYNPLSRFQIPYSDDEKVVSKDLIKVYKSFSTNNFPFYDSVKLEKVDRFDIKSLEIIDSANFSIKSINKDFGHEQFWGSLNIKD